MKKSFGSKMVGAVNVSKKGWQNVAWATVLTGLGAGLTYLTGYLSEIDMNKLGQWGPAVMLVVIPTLSYIKNKVQELLEKKGGSVPMPPVPQPQPNFHNELDFHLINKPK